MKMEVITLAIEILREIGDSEKKADEIVRTAKQQADDLIKAAEEEAEKLIREQLTQAEERAKEQIAKAEAEARAEAKSMKAEGQRNVAQISEKAAAQKEKAIKLLLEKVVSSPWQ